MSREVLAMRGLRREPLCPATCKLCGLLGKRHALARDAMRDTLVGAQNVKQWVDQSRRHALP